MFPALERDRGPVRAGYLKGWAGHHSISRKEQLVKDGGPWTLLRAAFFPQWLFGTHLIADGDEGAPEPMEIFYIFRSRLVHSSVLALPANSLWGMLCKSSLVGFS